MSNISQPLALITGATGALGPRIAWTLHAAGYRLRTLSAHHASPLLLPPNSDMRVGSITNKQVVLESMDSVDVVIHMAALLHITQTGATMAELYDDVNVKGTGHVVDAALRENVRRLVFFSTIAVYGETFQGVANENSPTAPETDYARSKLRAEDLVLAARNQEGASIGTVLRLAATYGPRVKGNYMRLLKSLSNNRFIPLGPGANRRTLIYDQDVARLTLTALEKRAAAGGVFNATDGDLHTVEDIIVAMCNALKRTPPRLFLPLRVARFAAATVDQAFKLAGQSSPSIQSALEKYTGDLAISGELAQRELGFSPLYDLNAGWEETVQQMRARGQIY